MAKPQQPFSWAYSTDCSIFSPAFYADCTYVQTYIYLLYIHVYMHFEYLGRMIVNLLWLLRQRFHRPRDLAVGYVMPTAICLWLGHSPSPSPSPSAVGITKTKEKQDQIPPILILQLPFSVPFRLLFPLRSLAGWLADWQTDSCPHICQMCLCPLTDCFVSVSFGIKSHCTAGTSGMKCVLPPARCLFFLRLCLPLKEAWWCWPSPIDEETTQREPPKSKNEFGI